MLDSLFKLGVAVRRLRSSPFGPWLDALTDWMADLGYTPWSRRSCAVLVADLGRWTANIGKTVHALDESVIAAYVEKRKTQRERRGDAALLFLRYLRTEGVAAPRPQKRIVHRSRPACNTTSSISAGSGARATALFRVIPPSFAISFAIVSVTDPSI